MPTRADDELEIMRLLARLAQAVDDRDADAYRDCLADEVVSLVLFVRDNSSRSRLLRLPDPAPNAVAQRSSGPQWWAHLVGAVRVHPHIALGKAWKRRS
jgi:hypothetical protein